MRTYKKNIEVDYIISAGWQHTQKDQDIRNLICFVAIALIPGNFYVSSYVSEEEKLKIIFSRHSKYSECDCIQVGGIHSHVHVRFCRQELGRSPLLAALADYCFMEVRQFGCSGSSRSSSELSESQLWPYTTVRPIDSGSPLSSIPSVILSNALQSHGVLMNALSTWKNGFFSWIESGPVQKKNRKQEIGDRVNR